MRLHFNPDWLLQHLAAVWQRQPAVKRPGSHHPVRLLTRHRPRKPHAAGSAGCYAVRYLHRTR